MPKARRRYSNKHRSRRYNRTKKGGMEKEAKTYRPTPFYRVDKTGKPRTDIGTATFHNPAEFAVQKMPIYNPNDPTNASEFFEGPPPEERERMDAETKRAEILEEFDKLMKKHTASNPQPVKEEVIEECVGPDCAIMGGRKSRKNRRKGRKSRKH